MHVGSWVDGNRDFSVRRLNAKGATLVNLAAEYKATDKVTVFGRIDNLFDKRWENPVGFLAPGLGAFGGVKVAFGAWSAAFDPRDADTEDGTAPDPYGH